MFVTLKELQVHYILGHYGRSLKELFYNPSEMLGLPPVEKMQSVADEQRDGDTSSGAYS